jgi:hypothetical protein
VITLALCLAGIAACAAGVMLYETFRRDDSLPPPVDDSRDQLRAWWRRVR